MTASTGGNGMPTDNDGSKRYPESDLSVMQSTVLSLGDWHREQITSGGSTHARFFYIEATPHLVLGSDGARRLALWESGVTPDPPEDLGDLISASVGYEVVEHLQHRETSAPCAGGLHAPTFTEAASWFLRSAVSAVRNHPHTSMGFAVVHTSKALWMPESKTGSGLGGYPGCLISKLFLPNSGPGGHTRVEYWDTSIPEAGFTTQEWDHPGIHTALRGYLPSPYTATELDLADWTKSKGVLK
jgi:hypothetical protein